MQLSFICEQCSMSCFVNSCIHLRYSNTIEGRKEPRHASYQGTWQKALLNTKLLWLQILDVNSISRYQEEEVSLRQCSTLKMGDVFLSATEQYILSKYELNCYLYLTEEEASRINHVRYHDKTYVSHPSSQSSHVLQMKDPKCPIYVILHGWSHTKVLSKDWAPGNSCSWTQRKLSKVSLEGHGCNACLLCS